MTADRPATPRAIIFDLDGTLADTFELIFASWNAAMREPLGRRYSPDEIKSRFGVPDTAMIQRELPRRELQERAVEVYHEHYRSHHAAMVRTFPGIAEMLEELSRRRVAMGLVTGKGRRTMNITLRELDLARHFGVAISGDDVERQKPAPDGLMVAAQALGARAPECAFVGDSPADVAAGKAAGMLTVVAGWHSVYLERVRALSPDVWAETPADIVSLVADHRG